MKVLHIPYTWHPDPIGGTEAYVEDLITALRPSGVESVVVAAGGAQAEGYELDGLRVYRLPIAQSPTLAALYAREDDSACRRFGEILALERPDIVHFHSLTAGASPSMVRLAGTVASTVVTYHTPTFSCPRGDLLHLGREVCDGRLDIPRCSTCLLQSRGLPLAAAAAVSRLPAAIGRLALRAPTLSSADLALRVRDHVGALHASFLQTVNTAHHVVALARWTQELLRLAGLPEKKLSLIRHGVPGPVKPNSELPISGPLRIAFVGRADPTKGLAVLLEALRSVPDARVRLEVFTPDLSNLNGVADARVLYRSGLGPSDVRLMLGGFHLLAVPSLWLETGPLVVLEAFAAGRPVLGSNLGGIAEMVSDGVDGLLLPPGNADAWARAIEQLAQDPSRINELAARVRPPRSHKDVANELLIQYKRLLASRLTKT